MHVEMSQKGVQDDSELDLSREEHDKTFRKVDWRLMPMLMALYLIANLDRANLGNAKIEGLEADLNMTGNDYNIANMMFFIPYILCEVPANSLLIKFHRPSTWIGIIVTAWGIVMTCSGFSQNFGGLVGCRVLLGVFEAGFFPGAVYILSQWYPPRMTQFRMSLLYCAAAMSGAFSGLLAAAIAKMSGLGGYNGWRWIFLLEGALTVLLGLASFFILPDSPSQSSRWLSEKEIGYLDALYRKYRAAHRQQDHPLNEAPTSHQKWKVVFSVLTDWQIYLQGLIFMSSSVPTYALKFTLPQIMVNMGFSSTDAQLLSAPPYVAGAISAIVVATFADRVFWRLPFIVGPQLCLMIAYAVLFSYSAEISSHVALCYTFVHVATISVYPIVPGANTWTLNNLAGQTKRAMGIALMIAVGNCGGIIGSLIFVADEKPRYETGWGTSLGFICAGAVSATTLEVIYKLINKRRDRRSREEIEATYSAEQLEAMGDRSPLFRYSL
ncbi:major facilitator superfamily domain-containing protein [Aspergillus pseudoustus]|uniref:Major facilitator superfamily domain-containing protein n=1 Tax=Aspergillus pseudoustus TaxID=1810923 RepID=A0ABR4K9E5_9EURO